MSGNATYDVVVSQKITVRSTSLAMAVNKALDVAEHKGTDAISTGPFEATSAVRR